MCIRDRLSDEVLILRLEEVLKTTLLLHPVADIPFPLLGVVGEIVDSVHNLIERQEAGIYHQLGQGNTVLVLAPPSAWTGGEDVDEGGAFRVKGGLRLGYEIPEVVR